MPWDKNLVEKIVPKDLIPVPVTITVNRRDLEMMASFACQHGEATCDKHDIERGGCCNACWASRWAKRMLKRLDQ